MSQGTAPAPAAADTGADFGGCSSGEAFALRVLGDDMAPEFEHGDIIIVEPDGALHDGSYVLAQVEGDWTLRQLARRGPAWQLQALKAGVPPQALADLTAVRGVVIQKAVPGKRRLSKFYV
jgi:SOS-response transcriptional repressor LexA